MDRVRRRKTRLGLGKGSAKRTDAVIREVKEEESRNKSSQAFVNRKGKDKAKVAIESE